MLIRKSNWLKSRLQGQLGFVMIGVLLLLLLISAIAITVAFTVTSERNISGSDEENNLAYYGAEAGMEKMTADLGQLFGTTLVPTPSQVSALASASNMPNLPGISYAQEYNLSCSGSGSVCQTFTDNIAGGPYAGLQAVIIPINLQVTASRTTLSNAQIRMFRSVEVGLIPVFQFGVFSEGDLSFFPGPPMQFNGRIHTNGNLFITANSGNDHLVFHDKVTAAQDVIITQLANTSSTGKQNGVCYSPVGAGCSGHGGGSYEGPVYISTAPKIGCPINAATNKADATTLATSCTELIYGSLKGGLGSGPLDTAGSAPWKGFSQGTANLMITNKETGAVPLNMPFVKAGVGPIEIIREPVPNEDPSTALGQSRLYNKAQIRVLLADTPGDLPKGGQPGDVWLDNTAPPSGATGTGVVYNNAGTSAGVVVVRYASGAPDYSKTWFANGEKNNPDNMSVEPANHQHSDHTWPMIGGWLRVEARKSDGTYRNVTQEWLTLGFARDQLDPDSEHGIANTVHPDAILIFQKPADPVSKSPMKTSDITGSGALYNWYPTNLFDTREGTLSDNAKDSFNGPTGSQCQIEGVMGTVELDVRNLQRWLMKKLPVDSTGKVVTSVTDSLGNSITTATGDQVENSSQNGYILYFSDRRGMIANTVSPGLNSGKRGDWGYPQQSQDINGDGVIETYGAANLGDAFNVANAPGALIDCNNIGRKYPVSGARHALKVIDGSSGNVPAIFDSKGNYIQGGFTVASEQPVYVRGNYNSKDGDATAATPWSAAHVSTAVIADAVTLLSQGWSDDVSFNPPSANPAHTPYDFGQRPATESAFRVAIAGGKNVTFNHPGTTAIDYGTDGGVHNFLRYLENWSGVFSHYRGSMVSFYFAHYGTGAFKTGEVYSPPNRDYSFDDDFRQAANMPPGTPVLLNITNLAYHQDFTPH